MVNPTQMKQTHLLNGDALKMRFPSDIEGDQIIIRECLVDGDVHGNDLESFYKTRERFLTSAYGEMNPINYTDYVVSELNKVQLIPSDAEVNLWFEDDLFCQVNMWFTATLLPQATHSNIYIVRPPAHTPYGFGGLSETELKMAYTNRLKINPQSLVKLWRYYQKKEYDALQIEGRSMHNFPFISTAIQAHLERLPNEENKGRPYNRILAIIKEQDTTEFGEVFRIFNTSEAIYGFGDLQVKRIFDQVIKEHNL